MRANLDLAHGLILGEAAMLALGGRIGRLEAHHVVEARLAPRVEQGVTLRVALAAHARRQPPRQPGPIPAHASAAG